MFLSLCNIQSLLQNLKPNTGLFYAVKKCNWIRLALHRSNIYNVYGVHLCLHAAIFVRQLCELIMTGQCLWKFLTSRFWEYTSRFSEDSALTYSISFSQIGTEVETVSAVAVSTDRMHISVSRILGLFWRLGWCRVRPPAESARVFTEV